DGVGTKLKLAFMTGKHDTVGEDLVNHCVNDILVHGARALFFLDYIAVARLEPHVVADIVAGLARGCRNAGAALIGGETAELPDFYAPGEYDLAGFIVGAVEEARIINGASIRPGMVCLGLPSSGLHTNGFSLARKAAFEIAGRRPGDRIEELGTTVAEALLAVHKSYAPVVHPLLPQFPIHGMAHITGGGLPGNLNRVLPKDCDAWVRKGSWPVPPVFDWLGRAGDLDREDMYSAFNMGIGFVVVVEAEQADQVVRTIERLGEKAYRIGEIRKGEGKVRLTD
ncbi:MAG TPA: phosphoribosylformylglycinamidine cyclo-ligase, partial [candidate division Zixibacteria bacterium]|nr:phosphoribosylformylglycinamidine cyclo-ligase [candidate division Zixibacteria bacterium]